MNRLKGFQKRYLRGLAHGMSPVVFIGHKGLTERVILSMDTALRAHELVKVKFVDIKDRTLKEELAERIEGETLCEMVGMIGHVGVFFRAHPDPEKRRITLPERSPRETA